MEWSERYHIPHQTQEEGFYRDKMDRMLCVCGKHGKQGTTDVRHCAEKLLEHHQASRGWPEQGWGEQQS